MITPPKRADMDGVEFCNATGAILLRAYEPRWWQFWRWIWWWFNPAKSSVLLTGPGWALRLRCVAIDAMTRSTS